MFIDFKVASGELDDAGRNVSNDHAVAVWQKGTGSREEALALVNEMFDKVESYK